MITDIKLKNLLQKVACGLVISKIHADGTFQIDYVNDGFCALFDRSREEMTAILEKDPYGMVYTEDLPRVKELLTKSLAQKNCEVTFRAVMPNGHLKWITDKINLSVNSDGSIDTYATYFDVTEQMLLQEHLRDIVHKVPGGICLYRWDGKRLNPIIVSEKFSEILGADGKRVLKETTGTFFRHVHPEDLPGLQKAIAEALNKTHELSYVYRSYNEKMKKWIWVYFQANTVPQSDGTQLVYVNYADITDEREMEGKLRESEMALEAATNHAGLWFWSYDVNKDRAYMGKRIQDEYGFSATIDHFQDKWLDRGIIKPEYHAAYRETVKKIRQGEKQVICDVQGYLPDGSLHWARLRMTNLLKNDGSIDQAVCTVELIDYEKELQARYNLEKERPIFEEKALLVYSTFNLNTGEMLEYNSSFWKAQDAETKNRDIVFDDIGANVHHFVEGEENQQTFKAFHDRAFLLERYENGQTEHTIDYRRRLPEGKIIWVRNILRLVRDPISDAILLFEYCYDINEQKMTEELLNAAADLDYERIASINLDDEPVTVFLGDREERSQIYDYATAIKDYALKNIPVEEQDLFLRKTAVETLRKVVADTRSYEFTTHGRRADGHMGIMKHRFVAYDRENKICLMTRTDVTELLLEEDRKKIALSAALKDAQKADQAKSDFLSRMSHDLRTPLNGIIGSSLLALDEVASPEAVKRYLTEISRAAQFMLELVSDILDLNSLTKDKMILRPEAYAQAAFAEDINTMFRPLCESKGITWIFEGDNTKDYLLVDKLRLKQIVFNLLSNAVKYTPPGGFVRCQVVTHIIAKDKRLGIFTFTDNGIGMSTAFQKQMYDMFSREESGIRETTQGSGIGLAITKSLVDQMGGKITCESIVGKGTTFIVEIPFDTITEVAVTQKKQAPLSLEVLKGKRVLLVEDHDMNAMIAARLLEKQDMVVERAVNGAEGVQLFEASPEGHYDAILMDIRMPVMDGLEAAKKIRSLDRPDAKSIRIIAMTANVYESDRERSRAVGMDSHLAKPIDPRELYQALGSPEK